MKHPLLALAPLVLAMHAPALGQASGFQPGELIYYSQAVPNASPTGSAILRIDPTTGATSPLFTPWESFSRRDALAFDAYRERVVFFGRFPDALTPPRLYALDGFGNTASLGFEGENVYGIAPGSGGRLYVFEALAAQIEYLDANDQRHVLMDVNGAQPYIGGGADVWALVYDAGTNSLFAGISRVSSWTCGLDPHSRVVRLPLSDDGSRLRADPECVAIPVEANTGSAPLGLTHGPDGKLLVAIYSGAPGLLPRLALVDPLTLAVTPFAFTDYTANDVAAGVWSRTLERAVVVDLFGNTLRSYGLGDSGAGTLVTPSMPISGAGSGEGVCLVEISRGEGTVVQPYCEAKTTADGCVPSIGATGLASASAASGFLIEATQVPAQRSGLFFYSRGEAAAIPFLGGTLCARFPLQRTPVMSSGGAGVCGGVLSIDFNAYMNSGADPLLGPGSVVRGQFWFRDPAHPIGGVGLSNAITFTVLP